MSDERMRHHPEGVFPASINSSVPAPAPTVPDCSAWELEAAWERLYTVVGNYLDEYKGEILAWMENELSSAGRDVAASIQCEKHGCEMLHTHMYCSQCEAESMPERVPQQPHATVSDRE